MGNNELYEILGEVDSVVYRNEDNGYTVITVNCAQEQITAVGMLPLVSVGEQVKLIGTYKTHHSYGEQFSVTACERSLPSTVTGIYKYLSSGAVKGIGPSRAQKLISEFGEKTLEVLANDPNRVSQIKGITLAAAEEMSRQLNNAAGIRELMLFLSKYSIPAEAAIAVWKRYSSSSIEIIRQNPYVLCAEGIDVSFKTADKIAFEYEHCADDERRIRAGILYVMNHNRGVGHTCLPYDKVVQTASQFLSISDSDVNACAEQMIADGDLISASISGREFLFIPALYQSEAYIAARIKMLLRFPSVKIGDADRKIAAIEKSEGIKYADLQKTAIKQALETGLLILTGGPGTGKTTTLKAILKILQQNGEKVLLSAPTGRAAQRMGALTGCEAKTVHRLLEASWDNDGKSAFKRNEKNLLKCDALVIDETSMMDVFLFESVMKALPLGCRLILVGDSDQLPSVGAGNVLADLVESGLVPVVALKEIFRQSMQSLIITNAHKIVSGEMPELHRNDNDFFFLSASDSEKIAQTIVDLCNRRLPNTYGYSPVSDIQVLSPSRKGALGVNELNARLQAAINPKSPDKKEISIGFNLFREGDKLMQMKNNYDIIWTDDNGETGEGIFNGDVGVLEEIIKSAQALKVRFDDRTAYYDFESASQLELAYATTVHKSQGNEFEAVIMPSFRCAPQLMYRNLLYTAVTRAKKLFIMVGVPSAVSVMVENNRRTKRYTALKSFLLNDDSKES